MLLISKAFAPDSILARNRLGVAFIKGSAVPFYVAGLLFLQRTDIDLFEDIGLAQRRSNRRKNLRELSELIWKHKNDLAQQSLQNFSVDFL
jgi:hypothetical protein